MVTGSDLAWLVADLLRASRERGRTLRIEAEADAWASLRATVEAAGCPVAGGLTIDGVTVAAIPRPGWGLRVWIE